MHSEKERYYYLDVLKAIAIFLVCSYHFTLAYKTNYSDGFTPYVLLSRFIAGINSVCIPLFFMVNGALLLNHDLQLKKHLKKSFVIFLQFIFWRTVTILIIAAFKSVNLFDLEFTDLFNALFLFGNIETIGISHFWFIPCLLCVYILFPFIKREYDYFMQGGNDYYLIIFMIILLILCFVTYDISTLLKTSPATAGISINGISENLNPFISLVGPMLFYFILGGLFHKKIEVLKNVKTYQLLLGFIFGAALLLLKWTVETNFIKESWDNVYEAYNSLPTLIMTSCIFILAGKVSSDAVKAKPMLKKPLEIISNNTMNVYYFHWIFGYTVLDYLVTNYISIKSIPLDYVKSIAIVVLFSLLGEVMKKIPLIKKLVH